MIQNVLASLAVRDLSAASQWYEKVLGRPADTKPMPEVAEWTFERGGVLQVYELPERAGAGSCTLAVSDIEEEARKLSAHGIDTSQRASGKTVKTLMIADLDGNHIAFAQALDPSISR